MFKNLLTKNCKDDSEFGLSLHGTATFVSMSRTVPKKSAKSLFCKVFAGWILVASILSSSTAYSASIYDGVRDTNYDVNANKCSLGTIDFDPFSNNKDFNFVIQNPTCAIFISTIGIALVAQGLASWRLCIPTNSMGLAKLAPEEATEEALGPDLPLPTITLPMKLAMRIGKCSNRLVEVSLYTSMFISPIPAVAAIGSTELPRATIDATRCCAAVAAYGIIVAAAISALAIIHDQAKIAYEEARICGHDWYRWTKEVEPMTSSEADVWASTHPNESPLTTGPWRRVNGYKKCLEDIFMRRSNACNLSSGGTTNIGDVNNRSITNELYREYIYGGKEYEDEGDGECKNPSTWNAGKRMEILGYDSDGQRYYMNGPGGTPVYACSRFLLSRYASEQDRVATKEAYECCKRRSQNSICIESRGGIGAIRDAEHEHKFCEIGTRCSVGRIMYDVYESRHKVNHVCAKTYSVCPYDHTLGGGTEIEEPVVSNDNVQSSEIESRLATDVSEVKNFCQVANHCSKIPILPSVRHSNLESSFISSACYDMKGDSQNVYGYTAQLIPINNKSFSAGMVQCYKETLENMFFNLSGRTECMNPDESPDVNGNCQGGVLYSKGQSLPGKSFFHTVQDKMRLLIKMCLCLSVVFFGVGILMAAPGVGLDKKKLLPYIAKLGLVIFFTMGSGWHLVLFDNMLSISQYLAQIVFTTGSNDTYQVNVNGQHYSCSENADAGLVGRTCVREAANPTSIAAAAKFDGCQFPRFNYAADPNSDDKYLAPQYPPGKEYLKIWDMFDCKLAFALGFGPEVSVPNLVMMILGGFLTGGAGIVFFVGAFFLAFILLSIILRAMHIFLISITATIIMLYVSPLTITCCLFARTKGIYDGWLKNLISFSLQLVVLFAYIGIVLLVFDKTMIGEGVTFEGDGLENSKTIICSGESANTSIYCIFNIKKIKTYEGFGLKLLGLAVPMLLDMNSTKMKAVLTSALIMAIVMKLMDQIPDISEKLIGGTSLKSGWSVSPVEMAQKAAGALDGIQQRGMRSAIKAGKTGISKAREARDGIKNFMQECRGKKPGEGGGGMKQDHAASSKASDKAGTSKGADSAAGSKSGAAGGAAAATPPAGSKSGGGDAPTPAAAAPSAPAAPAAAPPPKGA